MKKLLAILIAAAMLVMLLAACGTAAADTEPAAEETAETAETEETAETAAEETPAEEPAAEETAEGENTTICVMIADAGEIVYTDTALAVTDKDEDGTLTINDALICAHETGCPEGADGYATAVGDYGLSIMKLWNVENGGSYGYYVNNVMSMGLSDPIADGDYLAAYTYADLTAWSDAYSYFDASADGSNVTLTLSYIGFDANWNTVVTPLAGAVITVDGEATEVVTAEDGTATLTLEAGDHIISATCDDMTIVPPCAFITVG